MVLAPGCGLLTVLVVTRSPCPVSIAFLLQLPLLPANMFNPLGEHAKIPSC